MFIRGGLQSVSGIVAQARGAASVNRQGMNDSFWRGATLYLPFFSRRAMTINGMLIAFILLMRFPGKLRKTMRSALSGTGIFCRGRINIE